MPFTSYDMITNKFTGKRVDPVDSLWWSLCNIMPT